MLETGSTTGKHNTSYQLAFEARHLYLVQHLLKQHTHTGIDDGGKGLDIDFAGVLVADTRDGNNVILIDIGGEAGTEFGLKAFGLMLEDLAVVADVVGDHVTSQRKHRSMADNTLLEDGDVGSAATNIHQCHTGGLVAHVQDCVGGGDGFEYHAFDAQAGFGHGVADVADVAGVARDDVEVGHEAFACHTYGVDVGVEFVVVDDVVLGEDVDDFFAGFEHDAVLVFDEAVDVRLLDEAVVFGYHDATLVGAAFDVLAGDADIHFFDVVFCHFRCVVHGTAY